MGESSHTGVSLRSIADDDQRSAYLSSAHVTILDTDYVLTQVFIGFAKYMEWKYPVEVIITSKAAFRGAGAIEAAASL